MKILRFAQDDPSRLYSKGHNVRPGRRLEHPRFRKIKTFSPKNHLHVFRLEKPEDVDDTFLAWMGEAYEVGEQKHLRDDR